MRARRKNYVYCINFKIFPPVNFTEIFANFIMWLIGIIVKNTSETVIFCKNEPRKQFTCAPVERTVTFTADSLPGSPCFDGRALLFLTGAPTLVYYFHGLALSRHFSRARTSVCLQFALMYSLTTIMVIIYQVNSGLLSLYVPSYSFGINQKFLCLSISFLFRQIVAAKSFHSSNFCYLFPESFRPISYCFHDVF